MKPHRMLLGAMGAIVMFLLAAGCESVQSSQGPRLKAVKGQTLDGRVRILRVEASKEGDQVLIHGAVQRQSHTSYPIQTHVDVVVTGADGKVLMRSSTRNIFVARRGPGKGPDWTRFQTVLPGGIPADSTIRAVCHNGLHEADCPRMQGPSSGSAFVRPNRLTARLPDADVALDPGCSVAR